MYLYNDVVWLSEKLRDFALEWKNRDDLAPRAYGMVKLDPEIKILESFGKRAYTNELNAQRTIINDLLAGKPLNVPIAVVHRSLCSISVLVIHIHSGSIFFADVDLQVRKTSSSRTTKLGTDPIKASVQLYHTFAAKLLYGRTSYLTQHGPQLLAPSSMQSQAS